MRRLLATVFLLLLLSGSAGAQFQGPRGLGEDKRKTEDDKLKTYAATLMKQYDSNEDGILEADEWSKMRADYQTADLNGDKHLRHDENYVKLRSLVEGPAKETPKAGAVIELEVVLAEWFEKDGTLAAAESGKQVAERVAALEKEGKLAVNKRLRMTAYQNLLATMQMGERRARVTGVTSTAGRFAGGNGPAMQSSISFENIGVLMSARPTLVDDRIAIDFKFEQSAPRKRDDAPVIGEADGEKVRADSTGTLTVETNVSLTSGDTVLVGSLSENGVQQVLLLTARVAN